MRLTKLITVGVDIQDTIGVYVNLNDNLMRILENKYVGRCFGGAYVESIDELKQISPLIITRDGDPTHGTINVVARITATMFEPGEVITGCKVIRTIARGIVCSHPRAAILIWTDDQQLASIREGQIISVSVVSARYDININSISINARVFQPAARVVPVWILAAADEGAAAIALDTELARVAEITKQAEQVREENATGWKFFSDLLSGEIDSAATSIGITELIERPTTTGNVTRAGVARDTPAATMTNAVVTTATLPRGDVLLALLRDYYDHMRLIIEHIRIYNTPELVSSHLNLWRIYRKK